MMATDSLRETIKYCLPSNLISVIPDVGRSSLTCSIIRGEKLELAFTVWEQNLVEDTSRCSESCFNADLDSHETKVKLMSTIDKRVFIGLCLIGLCGTKVIKDLIW